jgi:hypothetical protein
MKLGPIIPLTYHRVSQHRLTHHSHSRPHQQSETLRNVVTTHIFRIALLVGPENCVPWHSIILQQFYTLLRYSCQHMLVQETPDKRGQICLKLLSGFMILYSNPFFEMPVSSHILLQPPAQHTICKSKYTHSGCVQYVIFHTGTRTISRVQSSVWATRIAIRHTPYFFEMLQ